MVVVVAALYVVAYVFGFLASIVIPVAIALLLAALGTAFGLLAGLYLGYVMIMGLSVGGYPVTYVFPAAGLLATAARAAGSAGDAET